MKCRCLILAVTLLLASGNGRAALAAATPEAEQQSRRSFERAESHFRAGLFAEALTEYQAGYDLHPLPGFLINIAQCQRRLGDLNQARVTYRKFVMVAPDSRFVPEVKKLIAELDVLVSDADKTAPSANATSAAGEARQAGDPTPAPSRESPPLPTPGATETVGASLVTVPETPGPPSDTDTRWWLWGTIGAAAVAAVATTYFVLRDPGTTTLHDGTLGTLRR